MVFKLCSLLHKIWRRKMSDLENYKHLIEDIFGVGTATFDASLDHTNNIIGALNNNSNLKQFTNCFTARLKSTMSAYPFG